MAPPGIFRIFKGKKSPKSEEPILGAVTEREEGNNLADADKNYLDDMKLLEKGDPKFFYEDDCSSRNYDDMSDVGQDERDQIGDDSHNHDDDDIYFDRLTDQTQDGKVKQGIASNNNLHQKVPAKAILFESAPNEEKKSFESRSRETQKIQTVTEGQPKFQQPRVYRYPEFKGEPDFYFI